MHKSLRKLVSPPSLRLNTTVVVEVVLILTVMLGVIFYYSHQTLRREAVRKAGESVDATILRVDNVLLSVEQAAGNFYWQMMAHLDDTDHLWTCSRRLVESNPNIMGCAIAFKPYYYPDKELFMAYVHRMSYDSPELVEAETFGLKPYTQQEWYTQPMKSGLVGWLDSRKNEDGFTFITFCLPIHDGRGENVGVMAVDVSIAMLSQIVLAAKPTPNSYSVMLDHKGSYIVHPDRDVRINQTAMQHAEDGDNRSARDVVDAMLAGENGNKRFHLNDEDWCVFYEPFVRAVVPGRAMSDLKWSIGVIYPEADIFGAYNHQFWHILSNALIGLIVFFVLCRIVISIQFKPLRVLTESAESIAEGNYNVTIPDTERNDEIGLFQQHFRNMQKSLVTYLDKQQQLTTTLEKRRETLRNTEKEIHEADRVKINFLHNITDQMAAPSEAIDRSVNNICNNYKSISVEDARREADNIKHQSEAIIEQLNQMLGKEAHS